MFLMLKLFEINKKEMKNVLKAISSHSGTPILFDSASRRQYPAVSF